MERGKMSNDEVEIEKNLIFIGWKGIDNQFCLKIISF